MKTHFALGLLLQLSGSVAMACACASASAKAHKVVFKIAAKKVRTPASLGKFASGNAALSLESQLGNLLLDNEGANVTLSIPAVILRSDLAPFGDGQTNAKMSLGSWKGAGFPAVGIQTSHDGKATRTYRFDDALKVIDYNETSLGDGWFRVQPKGWNDSFYFSFDTKIRTVADFVNSIPESYRTFADGRMAPNPAKVDRTSGIGKLASHDLGAGYMDFGHFPIVHGEFPENDAKTRTALGGVTTYGIDKPASPFKHLYTCFDARDPALETKLGIPSGAGWHHIGVAGETILNTIESLPLPIAIAINHSHEDAAYGLRGSITATWLHPDEVHVTTRGQAHWYLNPYDTEVCTEIWVQQDCLPSPANSWGLHCQ